MLDVIQSHWKDDNLMSSINSKSPSMIADEPRISYDYKLSRNLVRKIKTPSEVEEENYKCPHCGGNHITVGYRFDYESSDISS